MRLKDIFEAPPERGPRTNTRPTRPGQEVSGPITRGLPTRPGQDTSGPTTTLPTRPGQDRSGPIPGGARPEGPAAGSLPRATPGGARPEGPAAGMPRTAPGGARPEGPAAGMPTRPDQSTSGAPTGIRAPGTTSSNLRRGSKGSDVSSLQQMLIDKGYDLGDTGADGKFGPRTAAAVKQFQTDFGLQVDGIAGDQTMSALNRAQGGARPTVGEPGSMPRVTPGGARPTVGEPGSMPRVTPGGARPTVGPAGSLPRATPGGTPTFTPRGTVAGPGQNARPGGTPNPVRPTTPRTNRPI